MVNSIGSLIRRLVNRGGEVVTAAASEAAPPVKGHMIEETLGPIGIGRENRWLEWPAIEGEVLRTLREIGFARQRNFHDPDWQSAVATMSAEWRRRVRQLAGLTPDLCPEQANDALDELLFLNRYKHVLAPVFRQLKACRVLFVGQCYYYNWYLSRKLREHGWRADLYDWDTSPASQIYYHGQDFKVGAPGLENTTELLSFYLRALYDYDVFHFANSRGISFDSTLQVWFAGNFDPGAEIYLLKALGKIIVYTNNGCLDGVSQTAFSNWGPTSVCSICKWQEEPTVCSDERNLSWGMFRNSVADFQCLLGGNRVDFNDDLRVHEVPEAYCLEPAIWDPSMAIPASFRLPAAATGTVRLYHAVGNREERTRKDGANVKSTHVYLPIIEKMRQEGVRVELISPSGVPNLEVRFLQMQSDIVLEMLTYGWFGTNVREAMMLGKPVVCFIRPEWLVDLRREIPAYADELPIISATPETVEVELRRLIENPQLRESIGRRSREFALKWHSSAVAARRFDEIYCRLLSGDPLLRRTAAP